MKISTRKCPKCKRTLIATPKEWIHSNPTKCSYRAQRFIKPDTSSPLFLRIETKKPEDRKFLEEIMQKSEDEQEGLEFKELKEGIVFTKKRINGQVKVISAETLFEHCDRLIKEMRERESK